MKNKNILLICQYFYPEKVSSGVLPYELGCELSKLGYNVSALVGYPKEYVDKKKKCRKKEIRNLLLYFKDVGTTDIYNISWYFSFDRNNQSYRMLMAVCELIIKGLLQSSVDGSLKMMQFLDEQRMCRLYEKFILEYYRKHYPYLHPTSSQIKWALDDGFSAMLPTMQSDIMLSYKNRILIIDAKYYEHTTQIQYNTNTLHSNNLYQIFTYVKNKAEEGDEVAGILLYAKTDENILPNNEYMMSGNKISVKTLNLDCEFSEITAQLNSIADNYFQCQN